MINTINRSDSNDEAIEKVRKKYVANDCSFCFTYLFFQLIDLIDQPNLTDFVNLDSVLDEDVDLLNGNATNDQKQREKVVKGFLT